MAGFIVRWGRKATAGKPLSPVRLAFKLRAVTHSALRFVNCFAQRNLTGVCRVGTHLVAVLGTCRHGDPDERDRDQDKQPGHSASFCFGNSNLNSG
jgi:hypothetical protein